MIPLHNTVSQSPFKLLAVFIDQLKTGKREQMSVPSGIRSE